MTLPPIWQAIAASLLATALLAATGALLLARRLAAMARSRDSIEQRLARLTFEVRRLERLVAAATPARAAEPLVPLISIPDLARGGGPGDGSDLAEKHAEVWSLIDAGRSAREIADAIGRPIGEVELIAGLYRQHLAAHPGKRHADA